MVGENTTVWRGSNLPNDVAAGLDPVVQEGETCVGNEIGEAHICDLKNAVAKRICSRVDVVEEGGQQEFLVQDWALRILRFAKVGLDARAIVPCSGASGAPTLSQHSCQLCFWHTAIFFDVFDWKYTARISTALWGRRETSHKVMEDRRMIGELRAQAVSARHRSRI